MHIDCDSCAVRGPACRDCVVTVLLGAPEVAQGGLGGSGGQVDLDGAEQAAIAVLAGSGLVPPLRLLPLTPVTRDDGAAGCGGEEGRGGEAGRGRAAG